MNLKSIFLRVCRPAATNRFYFLPEFVFLIIALLSCSTIAILAPVASGPDETAHLYRVEQIARGESPSQVTESWDSLRRITARPIHPTESSLTSSGGYIDSAYHLITLDGYAKAREFGAYFNWPAWDDRANILTMGRSGEDVPVVFANTTGNSPVVYFPQVIGWWIGRFCGSVYLQVIFIRLAGVLAYCIGLFYAIRIIPVGKWVLAVIGLLPNALIVNSFATADTVTILLSVVFVCVLLKLLITESSPSVAPPPRSLVLIFCLIGALLAFVKMTYFPLIALIWVLPILRADARTRFVIVSCTIAFFTGCLFFMINYLKSKGVNIGLMFGNYTDPDLQKEFILGHPVAYLKLVLRCMLQQDVLSTSSLSPIIDLRLQSLGVVPNGWVVTCALMVSLFAHDFREKYLRLRRSAVFLLCIFFWALFVCCSILVCTALYMYWDVPGNPAITGVQARYFLPIMLLLLMPLVILGYEQNAVDKNDEHALSVNRRSSYAIHLVLLVFILCSVFLMMMNFLTAFYGWHPWYWLV